MSWNSNVGRLASLDSQNIFFEWTNECLLNLEDVNCDTSQCSVLPSAFEILEAKIFKICCPKYETRQHLRADNGQNRIYKLWKPHVTLGNSAQHYDIWVLGCINAGRKVGLVETRQLMTWTPELANFSTILSKTGKRHGKQLLCGTDSHREWENIPHAYNCNLWNDTVKCLKYKQQCELLL